MPAIISINEALFPRQVDFGGMLKDAFKMFTAGFIGATSASHNINTPSDLSVIAFMSTGLLFLIVIFVFIELLFSEKAEEPPVPNYAS